ncbi:MAG: bifunctional UDP-N-acetylglucosamine pyrophosphorylase / glucosamine-phosphate N-acetyltransferase, partial [Solirubrobacteraceae bacterium]|nr:bifunctional UDP-N-acetylglucosamine pyrophosphorylase / glucosamine-phosphate N-acetyltransferase [Solirubrobacteraceae bacterium]
MTAPTVVILAGGQGTRMRSRVPKMLHEVCGRPMIAWPVRAALDAGADRVVVVAPPDHALSDHLPEGVEVAVQAEPLGTGHALLAAADYLGDASTLVVVNGDVPLVTAELIAEIAQAHESAQAAATMATVELDDPSGYGRVVRDDNGELERVVETKVAGEGTDDELAIRETNTGVYAFDAGAVLDALKEVGSQNPQGETYLPDVLPVLKGRGAKVIAHVVNDPGLVMGVNDRAQLAAVRAVAQRRIHEAHMAAGVTIVDPDSTLVDADVELGQDTVVEPSCFLRGATKAGAGCRIGPLTTLIDVTLGDEVTVLHSYLQECQAHDGATIGPFAYIRPGTILREKAKAGTFVEIKNSDIGAGTKVPHLSYLGDADVGEETNIGAGNITANYDGVAKHRTTIGKRVKTSVDTS